MQVHIFMMFIAVNAISAVFWNSRPRLRLRPPRHHQESMQYSHHRAQLLQPKAFHPPMNHRAPPHHHIPIKTYLPPHSVPYVKANTPQHMFQYPPKHHHHLKTPYLPQNVKLNNDQVKEVEFINFVESNNDLQGQSDGSVHGYLSSSYKGWRPIAKPNYLYRFDNDFKQSSSTNDYYGYPTTEVNSNIVGKHQNSVSNLYGHQPNNNMEQLKSIKLTPEYSENKNVAIPPPPSFQNYQGNNSSFDIQKATGFSFQEALLQVGQSGGDPVVRKPFPKFQSKLKKFNTSAGALIPDDEVSQSTQSVRPQQAAKFKISRPRLRGGQIIAQNTENEQGSGQTTSFVETSTPPQFSPPANRPPLNLKDKITTKVRKRVRVPIVPQSQPQGYVNTEDLGNVFKQDHEQYQQNPALQNSISGERPSHLVITETTTPSNGYLRPVPQNFNNYNDHSRPESSTVRTPSPPKMESERFQHVKEFHHVPQAPINTVRDSQGLDPNLNENYNSPRPRGKKREREQPNGSVGFNENTNPMYASDFYMPTDFFKSSQLDGGHDPVSFMSMVSNIFLQFLMS